MSHWGQNINLLNLHIVQYLSISCFHSLNKLGKFQMLFKALLKNCTMWRTSFQSYSPYARMIMFALQDQYNEPYNELPWSKLIFWIQQPYFHEMSLAFYQSTFWINQLHSLGLQNTWVKLLTLDPTTMRLMEKRIGMCNTLISKVI